jgi:hypothetical protein
MPIMLTCTCGKKLKLPDESAGKKARCPGCKTVLSVAAATATAEPVPIPDQPEPEPSEEQPPRRNRPATAGKAVAPAPVKRSDEQDDEQLDEEPEPRPKKKRPGRRDREDVEDSEASEKTGRPKKGRTVLKLVLLIGCGGFLFLLMAGGGVIGYLLYVDGQRESQVAGDWEREDSGPDLGKAIKKFPFTRIELDRTNKRFVGHVLLGSYVSGRFAIVRSPGDGLIGMNVYVDETKGPDGKVTAVPKEKEDVMGFHMRVVDADHIEVKSAGLSDWIKFRRSTASSRPEAGEGSAAEPQPEATVPADVLYKDRAKYDGKWVVVIARVPSVFTTKRADGSVSASVELQGDDGRVDSTGDFEPAEWAKVPKLADGVRYEIMGQFRGGGNLGGRLEKCRFLGVSKGEGPQPVATLTAQELMKDAAKFKVKLVSVKGLVGGITKGPPIDVMVLKAAGTDKFIVCRLGKSQFNNVIKAGRGGEIEIKGVVEESVNTVMMNDCSVVNPQPANPTSIATFLGNFGENAPKADAFFKDKGVTLSARVDSVAEGKLVLTLPKGPKSKTAVGYSVVANFGPDWSETLAKVKAGDLVTVSGEYVSYQDKEISLGDCWLIPR